MKKQTSLPLIQTLDSLSFELEGDSIRDLLYRQGSSLKLDCLNWPKDFPYAPKTLLWLGRSESGIYLHFVVEEIEKRINHHCDNAPVWEDSCVEFFVALPSGKRYYNFEFNSLGYCLAARRKSREDYVLFGPEQLALIKRSPRGESVSPDAVVAGSAKQQVFKPGIADKTAELIHGTSDETAEFFPERADKTAGLFPKCVGKPGLVWSLTVYIPFRLLGVNCKSLPSVLRANFYKCCSACSEKHYLSWSPVHSAKPDFHRPEDFGFLFVGEQ
jgi:hypothetical protein